MNMKSQTFYNIPLLTKKQISHIFGKAMTTIHNIANCKKSLLKREIAGVLLLEQVHGLLVTTSVIRELPKSSDAQQILFALKAFIVIKLSIKTSNSSLF